MVDYASHLCHFVFRIFQIFSKLLDLGGEGSYGVQEYIKCGYAKCVNGEPLLIRYQRHNLGNRLSGCFLLVASLTYSSTPKTVAVFSSEASINFY
jgi:hypothetical protein